MLTSLLYNEETTKHTFILQITHYYMHLYRANSIPDIFLTISAVFYLLVHYHFTVATHMTLNAHFLVIL